MRTFPEMLDDARDGEEFGDLIQALLWSLEPTIYSTEED